MTRPPFFAGAVVVTADVRLHTRHSPADMQAVRGLYNRELFQQGQFVLGWILDGRPHPAKALLWEAA